jgi:hypothetical protein
MLSEAYLRVMKDDFRFDNQQVKIHQGFPEYTLDQGVYHEAGFDALMTGVVWFKLMTYLGRERQWPGTQKILETSLHNTLDKNKIPLASLRTSFNLDQPNAQGLGTDSKSFVFVL